MCCVSLVLCPELTTPFPSPPPLPLPLFLPSFTVEVSIPFLSVFVSHSFEWSLFLFPAHSVCLSSPLSFSVHALHCSACAFLSLFAFLPTWLLPSFGHRSVSLRVSRSVLSDSLRPHESQHTRPPCPSPTPKVHSDSCPSSKQNFLWWKISSPYKK